jgi:hypothetical protein
MPSQFNPGHIPHRGQTPFVGNGPQTIITFSHSLVSNNWSLNILDYNTNQVIKKEISGTIYDDWHVDTYWWGESKVKIITESGYAVLFRDNSTGDTSKVIFFDILGNIIDTYESETGGNFEFDTVSGKIIYFKDVANGVFCYFNGTHVGYHSYIPSDDEEIYPTYDGDGVTSDGSFTFTHYIYATDINNVYVFNSLGIKYLLQSYNATDYSIIFYMYNAGFFIFKDTYDENDGIYTDIKIYSSDGTTILQHIDISGDGYTYHNIRNYGFNKIFAYYYSDNQNDMLFVNYDGVKNTITTTRHEYSDNVYVCDQNTHGNSDYTINGLNVKIF